MARERRAEQAKYGNAQTVHEGVVYASRLEAECARVLDLLKRQGRIVGYERQRSYELAPARKEKAQRACSYVADFCVALHPYGQGRTRHIVIEAKGVRTAAGQLKLRWFSEIYPQIPVHVVRAPADIIGVSQLPRAKAPGLVPGLHRNSGTAWGPALVSQTATSGAIPRRLRGRADNTPVHSHRAGRPQLRERSVRPHTRPYGLGVTAHHPQPSLCPQAVPKGSRARSYA